MIPLVWDDDELAWLEGTYLKKTVSDRKKDLERRWSEAVEALKHAGWDVSSYTMSVDIPVRSTLFI